MNIELRTTLLGVIGATCLAVAAPAMAVPMGTDFNDVGDFGNLWTFSGTGSESGSPISGNVYWDIFDGSYFVFSIENTSPDNSRITGLGWDFPTGVSPTSETFSSLGWSFDFASPTLPGNLSFSACTFSGPNCGAASGGGVTSASGFNWFYVGLTPAGGITDAMFAEMNACLRFGSVGEDREDSGVACRDSVSVPEPGAITLLGLGLFGVAFLRRRRYS